MIPPVPIKESNNKETSSESDDVDEYSEESSENCDYNTSSSDSSDKNFQKKINIDRAAARGKQRKTNPFGSFINKEVRRYREKIPVANDDIKCDIKCDTKKMASQKWGDKKKNQKDAR